MREEITCDECGKVMTEGYCIDGGREHYCSDGCLHKHYTDAEYLEMYDCGNGDSFWTRWDEDGNFSDSDVFPN